MSRLRLLTHQLRYDQKLFWRNPASVFFSVALPLIFLLLLGAVFGEAGDRDERYGLLADQYLVPAIMTLGIVSATFVNIAIGITFERELGVLKRMRGTPLPTSVFVASRIASAVVNATLIAVAIMLVGALVYGVGITGARLAGVAVATVAGSVAFCALGFALSIVIPNQSAAPGITNVIVLPLYFVSGVFGDASGLPDWLATVGEVFPIQHLGALLFETFSPGAGTIGFHAGDLAIVAAWGAAAFVVAILKFRWDPRGA